MDLNVSQFLSPGRKEFVKGTLLLTGAGLFCRILGFFYRIYMSRTIGAEGLGLYNMIHPFFSIAFALCAGSIQTALSQYVAANREKGWSVFLCGLALSLSLSVIPVLLLCKGKIFLASNVLSEPQAARYLPVLAVSVPFACLHACINGYYYGMNKAHIPSFSQIAEQMIRMGAVWLLVIYLEKNGKPVTVGLAVEGHVIGEMASAAFTFLALLLVPPQKGEREGGKERKNLVPILTLALPLMGNRLVLNLLGSAEAILIPSRLIDHGLTNKEALSVYGVLTSMALPFILFPSAITNSMAVLLLPSAARAQAMKAMALAFTDKAACEQLAAERKQSHFSEKEKNNWFVIYMDYLYDQGCLDEEMTPPTLTAAQDFLTYGEAAYMAGSVSGKLKGKAGSTRNNREQAIPADEWWELYDAIRQETDPEGEIQEIEGKEELEETE